MRLACVKRAASVDSEPGSNSRLNRLKLPSRSIARLRERPPLACQQKLQLFDRSGIELKITDELPSDCPICIEPARRRPTNPAHSRTFARSLRRTDREFYFASNQIFNDLRMTTDDPLG